MAVPRVRPRIPVEELVDTAKHPPRRTLATVPTEDEATDGLHWTRKLALVALAVFWVSIPLAGLLGPLLGPWAGLGLLGLGLSSIVVSWLMGAE